MNPSRQKSLRQQHQDLISMPRYNNTKKLYRKLDDQQQNNNSTPSHSNHHQQLHLQQQPEKESIYYKNYKSHDSLSSSVRAFIQKNKISTKHSEDRNTSKKSDSSIDCTNIVTKKVVMSNNKRTKTNRKRSARKPDPVIKSPQQQPEFSLADEVEAENCFTIIKDAITDVVDEKLKQILHNHLPSLNNQIENIFNEIKKNDEKLVKSFTELNSKIVHYGEDHCRHFRYLCMKLEYDKLFYQNMSNNANFLNNTCPQPHFCKHDINNTKANRPNVCSECNNYFCHDTPEIPLSPLNDTIVIEQRSPRTIVSMNHKKCGRNFQISNNHKTIFDKCNEIKDEPKDNNNAIVREIDQRIDDNINGITYGDDLQSRSVLSILEQFKKHKISDMPASNLEMHDKDEMKDDKIYINHTNDCGDCCTNVCYSGRKKFNSEDNSSELGLKDILATIQKYYPSVGKSQYELQSSTVVSEIECNKRDFNINVDSSEFDAI